MFSLLQMIVDDDMSASTCVLLLFFLYQELLHNMYFCVSNSHTCVSHLCVVVRTLVVCIIIQ